MPSGSDLAGSSDRHVHYLIPSEARDLLERFRNPRARSLASLGMR
jgi:hypothetical protein